MIGVALPNVYFKRLLYKSSRTTTSNTQQIYGSGFHACSTCLRSGPPLRIRCVQLSYPYQPFALQVPTVDVVTHYQ